MYTLSKGPSKFVASTRRGPPRGFDVSENPRDQSEKGEFGAAMSAAPKAFFNHNGSKPRNQPRAEPKSAQHQDCAKFFEESWNKAMREYTKDKNSPNPRDGNSEWYKQREPNPALENFRKFDLEEWWGKRQLRVTTEPC